MLTAHEQSQRMRSAAERSEAPANRGKQPGYEPEDKSCKSIRKQVL